METCTEHGIVTHGKKSAPKRAAYEEFIQAADALPEEVLFAANQPAWQTVALSGYRHYEDFEDHLRDWLRRIGA